MGLASDLTNHCLSLLPPRVIPHSEVEREQLSETTLTSPVVRRGSQYKPGDVIYEPPTAGYYSKFQ